MPTTTIRLARLLTLGLALAGGPTAPSSAALIVYEGFDYLDGITGTTVNTLVGDSAGGQGWTAPWTNGQENGSAANGSVGVESPGLAYAALAVTGQALSDPTSASRGARREFDATGLGADGTSVWFSALYQHTNAGSDFRVKFFADSSLILTGSNYATAANSGIGFNYSGTNGLRIENQATQLGTGTVLANFTTHFVVGRVDFQAGNDDVRLWVNPALDAGAPADLDAAQFQSTALQATLGQAVAVRWGGSGTGLIDEIRLGTTFAEVTPVPEPAALAALSALAAVGWALVRRRRQHS